MKRLMAMVALALLTAVSSLADTITLTAADSTGASSFIDGARWSNGEVPSPGNDYVVALGTASGQNIKTPAYNVNNPTKAATNVVFAGKSLTLGSGTAAGRLNIKTVASASYKDKSTITISDLRLVHKDSYILQGDGTSSFATLYGNISFLCPMASVSTTSTPYFSVGANRVIDLYSALSAEPGYGFKVIHSSDKNLGWVRLMGDNPGFKGYMAVASDDTYLTAETSGALGPEPDEPTVLLNIRDGGAFGVHYSNVDIDQPNRGISVTGTAGGKLYAASDKTLTTSMFITTEATKSPLKKIGAGTVLVTGACDVGDIEIQAGVLGLAGDVASDVVISNSARLAVASTDSTLTLSGSVTFADSGNSRIWFPPDENGKPGGTVVLDKGFTSNVWPIPWVKLGSMPSDAVDVTLFRVHPSVRSVTSEDFSCKNAAKNGYSRRYEITMDEDGMQVVKWVQYANSSVVRMKASVTGTGSDSATRRMLESDPWEDETAPSPGKNYLVDATTAGSSGTGARQTLYPSKASEMTAVFPGDSLTFKGSSSYLARFGLKAKETIVTNLIVSGTAEIVAAAYYGNGDTPGKTMQTLGGTLQVAKGATLQLHSTNKRGFTIASQLSGSGSIDIRPTTFGSSHNVAKDYFTAYLTGDNSAYCGNINVWGHADEQTYAEGYMTAKTHPVTLRMADGKNLGGDCSSWQPEGFHLRGACRLWPTATMAISGVNRGVKFSGNAFLEVDGGQTLTIDSPVAWVGNVYKQGAGTLALGNAREMDAATNSNCLDVVEGMVKTTTTNGMNRIQARLYAGTSIAVEADHAAGTPLGDFGYYNVDRDDPFDLTDCGGTLAVTVEDVNGTIAAGGRIGVNLLTVSSTAADALEGHITASTVAGKKGVVTRNAADSEGRVTFSAAFNNKGLIISFH